MKSSDTCVIDLSGLSAVGLHIKVDRKKYREDRINFIRRKLTENTPQLVVINGFTGERYFREIVGCDLVRGGVVEYQKTLFLFADHPVNRRFGNTDQAWKDLGILAQGHSCKAALVAGCRNGSNEN